MIWPATTGSGRSFGTAKSSSPAPAPVAIYLAASSASSRLSVVTLEASRCSMSRRDTNRSGCTTWCQAHTVCNDTKLDSLAGTNYRPLARQVD